MQKSAKTTAKKPPTTKKEGCQEPLTTQKPTEGATDKSCQEPLTTPKTTNDNIFRSCHNVYYYYYYFNRTNNDNNSKLSIVIDNSFTEYFQEWINVCFNPDLLKIIYCILQTGFCYSNGLAKLYREYVNTFKYRVNNLLRWGIIEPVDKETNALIYKRRSVLKLDAWHFEKADFYKLTDTGKQYFEKLDYKLSLKPTDINRVNKWNEILHKTHDRLKRETKSEENKIYSYKTDWYKIFKEHRQQIDDHLNISWLKGKIENFEQKYRVKIDENPEILLEMFNKQLDAEE